MQSSVVGMARNMKTVQFSGLRIQVVAVVEQIRDDGQLRIERSANEGPRERVQSSGLEPKSYRLTGRPAKLLTLSGGIDAKRLKLDALPVVALKFNDPNSKTESSIAESGAFGLELSDL